MIRGRVGLALVLLGAVVAGGCASDPPPRAAEPVSKGDEQAIDDPSRLGVTSDIGGLPEEAMERAFAALGRDVQGCVTAGYAHIESLGGKVTITLHIDTKGTPSDIYLSESALGDRNTEKCILEAARAQTWPHAVGGVGVASSSFDTLPSKERAICDAKQVRSAIQLARANTQQCRRNASGAFVVTAYLEANGHVQAAGLATSTPEGAEAADCIVDLVRKMKFGAPGKAAKLSFVL